ncbi:hypothetical protein RN001_000423 [Aquatica leii]|uniref:Dynactin subunit 6 n=1 Tax=Aquatica leii TaxID=1421715 RepID=A0AAN7Q726_9COLE|nr:hypothetical protein RN001_000423 [Aquatica leii]
MTSENNINVMPGAIVCEESKLDGDITIGSHCIIHPAAIISAEAGPIILGDFCLVEEQAKIIHRLRPEQTNNETTPVLIIGSHNVFEIGCTVEAAKIGSNNVFESKCFVSNKVNVTNGCIIGAGCKLIEEQTLKNNTIVYGSKCFQREGLDRPVTQTAQMDTLSKMLPNYHHIRRPMKKDYLN